MAMSDVLAPKTQGQTATKNKGTNAIAAMSKPNKRKPIVTAQCGVVFTIARNSGYTGSVTVKNTTTGNQKSTLGSTLTFYQQQNVACSYAVISPKDGTATITLSSATPAPYGGKIALGKCTAPA